jgi:hypothetical protein
MTYQRCMKCGLTRSRYKYDDDWTTDSQEFRDARMD